LTYEKHSGYVKCVTHSNFISSLILTIQGVRKFDRFFRCLNEVLIGVKGNAVQSFKVEKVVISALPSYYSEALRNFFSN
jgi:hypothetical protein